MAPDDLTLENTPIKIQMVKMTAMISRQAKITMVTWYDWATSWKKIGKIKH